MTLPTRQEVAIEHTWDATNVFANDEAWLAAIEETKQQAEKIRSYQGKLSDGPETIVSCMDDMGKLISLAYRVYIYAGLFYSVDTGDQSAAEKNGRAGHTASIAMASASFIEPELLAIGFDTLDKWVADHESLTIYAHYFDTLKQKADHVRSAEVEELLSQASDVFGTGVGTHSRLVTADLTFPPLPPTEQTPEPAPLSVGNIGEFLTHPDRELRKNAWTTFADTFLQYKNGFANSQHAGIKRDVFYMKARRYDSSLEASLSSSHIPVEVFHNTIETYKKHLPTWHRYWRARRKALGYDTLHPYDEAAPLTKNKPHVPYEQSVEWILEGVAPLGEEYVEISRKGMLEQRWVDIYPNKGKRNGAFSFGTQGTHPFIMMNYGNDLFGMSTLAHELGHSMHSYLTWQNQPRVYADYTLFVAEVASNFNQALVRAHLFEKFKDDRDFQIALIEEAMANFRRYFFIMPTLARFELAIHEQVEKGQPLTAGSLISLMADLFEEGYGGEVQMDKERVGITWAQFHTHMYSNFYVYQYTTGISGAHALAKGILAGEDGAVDRYLQFLRTGSAMYPLDVLKMAGVDMTSPEPVETTFGVLADLVDRLESLTG